MQDRMYLELIQITESDILGREKQCQKGKEGK